MHTSVASEDAVSPRRAFTLVEVLVVCGIIALMVGLVMPALASARSAGRAVACASNLRQLGIAMLGYAADNNGRFPPNFDFNAGNYWSDPDRAGGYLSAATQLKGKTGGGVFLCPNDADAISSCSCNVWASSLTNQTGAALLGRGVLFDTSAPQAPRMILLAESFSGFGSRLTGWYPRTTIGFDGLTPANRFGANGGINPPISMGRFKLCSSELDFSRHRLRSGLPISEPVGRANFCFADGHVALLSDADLVDGSTGLLTGMAYWSPLDLP